MEMLNFSLWFTLMVWSINVTSLFISEYEYIRANKYKEAWEYDDYPINFMSEFYIMIIIPAPAILLEYLIVR